MSTPNPLSNTYTNTTPPPPISTTTLPIAGILTTIQGLDELPTPCTTLAILWLLHPRNQTASSMLPYGSTLIHAWNAHRASLSPSSSPAAATTGLIAISFDQRNHGTRLVDQVANESWREGNKRHAQDMFGIYQGTASDVQGLMEHVGGYLFAGDGEEERRRREAIKRERHLVLGISLGGHAAWQLWWNEIKVEAAVVVIGCPDYMGLMTDRARLSKLPSYLSSSSSSSSSSPATAPPFLGSSSFPPSLVSSCQTHDPKAQIFGLSDLPLPTNEPPSPSEQSRLRPLLDAKIKGKSVLVCSGAVDKLVPYHCSEPFLGFLKQATTGMEKKGGGDGKEGWWSEGGGESRG